MGKGKKLVKVEFNGILSIAFMFKDVLYNILGPYLVDLTVAALLEEIAHPTVYHHHSLLSVDIQLSGMIKHC